jgi:Ca-activated chloride channel family protein
VPRWHRECTGACLEPGSPELRRAACLATLLILADPSRAAQGAGAGSEWAEPQRAFLQDGPGLLLTPAQRQELMAVSPTAREAFVARFLADPLPATAENELATAIARRQRAAYELADTPLDPRWQAAFLLGPPVARQQYDCGAIFRRFEVWSYPAPGAEPAQDPARRFVLFFEPEVGLPWRLWSPTDHRKLDVYADDMQYLMQYWQDNEGKTFRAERFDFQLCPGEAKLLDDVTGVWAASQRRRPAKVLPEPLSPPRDLAAWVAQATAEPAPAGTPLEIEQVLVQFPSEHGAERLLARVTLVLSPAAAAAVGRDPESGQHQLQLTAVLEQDGRIFDRLRWRFAPTPPAAGVPLALAAEVPVRPGRRIVGRWHLTDSLAGREVRVTQAFTVPREAQPVSDPPLPEAEVARLAVQLADRPLPGADAIVLVPPPAEVVLGAWRAETIVSGSRIVQVAFYLDDRQVMRVNRAPFSADLPLGDLPREQVVRVEGYDAAGALVASDQAIVNQPRGTLRVRILEPRRGATPRGRTLAKAAIVVPEGKRIERVEFRVNDELAATREQPPWEEWLDLAAGPQGLAYLSVTARLADGQSAEDVRFLGSEAFGVEESVDLVELYTTVTGPGGRLVADLGAGDFEVSEDGRRQAVRRVEVVRDLPLSLGLALDISSSMNDRVAIAKEAAGGFLRDVLEPGDRAFAVTFADEPRLLQPVTSDVAMLGERIAELRAYGNTALHDALATSLYYASALDGQKALVLLSDGDDTASSTAFRQVLEYARRGSVVVYAVGLGIGAFDVAIRRKLESLAAATGGRTFFVDHPEELAAVYAEVGRELRARYLISYVSDARASDGAFREVRVRVKGGALRARTAPGYYP